MKYMGSKRAMLRNGLGTLVATEAQKKRRFVDLFAGSAAVSWFVAQSCPVEVLACDLQRYSVVLANSVIRREQALQFERHWIDWAARAFDIVREAHVPSYPRLSRRDVAHARAWCEWFPTNSLVRAYGGHYYSPKQAVWIEALRATVPKGSYEQPCIAALVVAASRVAAAPGHTAQPFQPTASGLSHLSECWSRDLPSFVEAALANICDRHAKVRGTAVQGDANNIADQLQDGDLVFLDPPYSGVHYSRFYHVLECIAQGSGGEVSGVGRYPPQRLRPQSKYSTKTTSSAALADLLEKISDVGASAILTFPAHACSNGLSGESVREIARRHFRVKAHTVLSRFSTLGGSAADSRAARQQAHELILHMQPR